MDGLSFLGKPPKQIQPVYVLAGDEDFIKRLAMAALKDLVLGQGDQDFSFASYPGDKAEYASIRSELEALPFLGNRRLVAVYAADPFVTKYRASLEKYVAKPSASGVLVLDVKSWPGNTRLAKALPDSATITCKAPSSYKLPQWCSQWAQKEHGKQLTHPAAQLLVDLVGNEMGLLDQELTKLAVYVGKGARIDVDDVDALVGRSQGANVFKVFDAIGAGKLGEALKTLGQVFADGEEPIRTLGAFSMQLRRLAQVSRLTRQGQSINKAFDLAGVMAWPAVRQSCEQQLKRIGTDRIEHAYDWLLEVDLGMKGSSPLPPRVLLERLLVRLVG